MTAPSTRYRSISTLGKYIRMSRSDYNGIGFLPIIIPNAARNTEDVMIIHVTAIDIIVNQLPGGSINL